MDTLIEEGLLTKEYVESFRWNMEDQYVDYGLLHQSRFQVLKKAYDNSRHQETEEYREFLKENEFWLEDFCLFISCKKYFEYIAWQDWEEEIKFRKPEALKKYKEILKEDIEFQKFVQFKFYEQWGKLKEYANEKEIEIIGDIPIYMAEDSADVWQTPSIFQLDQELNPKKVAGVPPDAFSETG